MDMTFRSVPVPKGIGDEASVEDADAPRESPPNAAVLPEQSLNRTVSKENAIPASSSTSPFPEFAEVGMTHGADRAAAVKAAAISAQSPLSAPSPAGEPCDALQETVRQVRREIKKSANWQSLPPIVEGEQLDGPSGHSAPSVPPVANISPNFSTADGEVTPELIASGVTYALTLCSDLVSQFSKVQDRMKLVEEKVTRMNTEVVNCFQRTEMLREMVEMEQSVRVQDVTQLQRGLQKATDKAERAQIDVESRQAQLATFMTGNMERLATGLDKKVDKLTNDILSLQKQLEEQEAAVTAAATEAAVAAAATKAAVTTSAGRIVSAKALPTSPNAAPPTPKRRHRAPSVGSSGIEANMSPVTSPRMSRSSSPGRTRGLEVPAENRIGAVSTSARPMNRGPLSERASDIQSARGRKPSSPPLSPQKAAALMMKQPSRANPDDDDRDGFVLPPRERTGNSLGGLSWKCSPSAALLCRVAGQDDPNYWVNQEQDFVTVEAASIWV